ncbi:hypothetical protein SAMN04489761_3690 [Tenacibaculum sp. MAR_2009_124]|uniref:hypothetical protein n=1 Tax=Tenacibaculum sp. MAR_2009_124 TaxID=1250059 RepID=UPI000899B63A|nr:hypothetical protein [Tenacibaculum sp. MAR_2009_124]SEC82494.1 hypothetical protein SAMN04489761_3690 [Tenacibaculum sp. MAR_2009_124]
MSYKDFVNINTTFDKEEFYANEEITGTITVRNDSPIDLELENIKISLTLKHYGKNNTDSINLSSQKNYEYKRLSRKQIIKINFSLPPAYNITFEGKNVTQSTLIVTKVDITKECEKLLRNEKLSSFKLGGYVKGLFTPDFYDETNIIIAKGNTNYELKNASGYIHPGMKKGNSILVISGIAAIVIGILFYVNTKSIDSLLLIGSIYAILVAAIYHYKIGPSNSIGPINFKLQNLIDNSYEVNLKFKKRTINIKEIRCQLIGQEKVTYQSGKNRATSKAFFYNSKPHRILPQGLSVTDTISFPEKTLPISIKNDDFEIIWYFKITIRTRNNKVISGKHIVDLKYRKE